MMLWGLIGIASISALAFRALPFALRNNRFLPKKDSRIHKFLVLSCQTMLGLFAYASLFESATLSELQININVLSYVGTLIISVAFFAVLFGARLTPIYLAAVIIFGSIVGIFTGI